MPFTLGLTNVIIKNDFIRSFAEIGVVSAIGLSVSADNYGPRAPKRHNDHVDDYGPRADKSRRIFEPPEMSGIYTKKDFFDCMASFENLHLQVLNTYPDLNQQVKTRFAEYRTHEEVAGLRDEDRVSDRLVKSLERDIQLVESLHIPDGTYTKREILNYMHNFVKHHWEFFKTHSPFYEELWAEFARYFQAVAGLRAENKVPNELAEHLLQYISEKENEIIDIQFKNVPREACPALWDMASQR